MTLVKQLQRNLSKCHGVAAAVRVTTTFNPDATIEEMVAAGIACGLNPNTVRKQFNQARREDAEVEELTKGMSEEQFINAVIRSCH